MSERKYEVGQVWERDGKQRLILDIGGGTRSFVHWESLYAPHQGAAPYMPTWDKWCKGATLICTAPPPATLVSPPEQPL